MEEASPDSMGQIFEGEGGCAMTRWEYRFTHITNVNFPDRETAQDLVNRLGSDGWELVGFDVHNQAWFKRRLARGVLDRHATRPSLDR